MRDYLLFQLYGPLAAWGDIAVGEARPSALSPTKSAVLGLVAAAIGIKRPNTAREEAEGRSWEAAHIQLAESYGMAVKVESVGVPLSDYHTAEVPKGAGHHSRREEVQAVQGQKKSGTAFKGTILSRRDYRQDAYCTVALWARERTPYSLETLRRHLLTPRFVLYLGRKACPPALPLDPRVVSAESFEQALDSINLSQALLALWGEKFARRMVDQFPAGASWFLWDDDAQTHIPAKPSETITRRDVPLSRRRWQFAVRIEHRAPLERGGRP